jgi:hypothetical protein
MAITAWSICRSAGNRRAASRRHLAPYLDGPVASQISMSIIAPRTALDSRGHAATIWAKSLVSNSVSTDPRDACFPDGFCDKWLIANPPSWVRLPPAPLTDGQALPSNASLHSATEHVGTCPTPRGPGTGALPNRAGRGFNQHTCPPS